MSRKSSNQNAIDFAKGTIAPRAMKTGPPNLYWQTAFPKRLDASANFAINDSGLAASTGEKVPTSTGLIIWQPNRGAASLYRFGIVPGSASTVCLGNNTRGLNLFGTNGTNTTYLNDYYSSNNVTLNWQSNTAVPYNAKVQTDVIKIAPDLSQSFSQVRIYSGDVRVICDTVPIGNTALNGYFSAGAFTDSRDVSQVAEGTSPFNCFDPTDLVQSSVTSKDGYKEIQVMKGMVMVVGSDVQPFYAPPNVDDTDTLNAGWTPLTVTAFANTTKANITGGTSVCISQSWISPWNTKVTDSNFVATGVNVFNPGAINQAGVLDIQVVLQLPVHAAGSATSGQEEVYHVVMNHVFVTCSSSNYACTYQNFPEVYKYPLSKYDVAPGSLNQPYGMNVKIESNPKMYQLSMTTNGMYLGTQVNVYFLNLGSNSDQTLNGVFSETINVRARSIYNQGELGPMRVIRWDGLSDGQQMKVDGVINAQCIPEGAIAPFVQSAAMYSDSAQNLNAMTFVSELYNGDTPFRRIWVADAYEEFIRTVFPTFSAETIVAWKQPKLLATAEGAGMFDSVGDFLKHATKIGTGAAIGAGVGSMFGGVGALPGAAIGAVGPIIDTITASTAGQFGRAPMRTISRSASRRRVKRRSSVKRSVVNHAPPTAMSLSAGKARKASRSRSRSVKRAPIRKRSMSAGSHRRKSRSRSRSMSAGSHKSRRRSRSRSTAKAASKRGRSRSRSSKARSEGMFGHRATGSVSRSASRRRSRSRSMSAGSHKSRKSSCASKRRRNLSKGKSLLSFLRKK